MQHPAGGDTHGGCGVHHAPPAGRRAGPRAGRRVSVCTYRSCAHRARERRSHGQDRDRGAGRVLTRPGAPSTVRSSAWRISIMSQPDAAVRDLVSTQELEASVTHLCSLGEKVSGSEEERKACNFLTSRLEAYGYTPTVHTLES